MTVKCEETKNNLLEKVIIILLITVKDLLNTVEKKIEKVEDFISKIIISDSKIISVEGTNKIFGRRIKFN